MTVVNLAWETLKREREGQTTYWHIEKRRFVYEADWKLETGRLPGHYVRHLPTKCLFRVTEAFTYLVAGPDFDGIFDVAVEAREYVRILEA